VLSIFRQILARAHSGESCALCTIVRTLGSTPQARGAAMLVLQDGKTMGTLGGGCVEAEVRSRALQLLPAGPSRLLTFRLDQDYGWDDGLVCGGVMDVAVLRIGPGQVPPSIQVACNELEAGRSVEIPLDVTADDGQPRHFTLPIAATPKLLIAGAGHVGQALAAMAAMCEFAVTVVDDRNDLLDERRFPTARRIGGEIQSTLGHWPIDADTYVVIVTRGHRHDADALAAVVRSPAAYVGLIGSKRKIRAIFAELHREGIGLEHLERVHAPIGLEIGAVTPAEIAVSILAELISKRHGCDGAISMKMRPDRVAAYLLKAVPTPK